MWVFGFESKEVTLYTILFELQILILYNLPLV